jgi:hypothetical protein
MSASWRFRRPNQSIHEEKLTRRSFSEENTGQVIWENWAARPSMTEASSRRHLRTILRDVGVWLQVDHSEDENVRVRGSPGARPRVRSLSRDEKMDYSKKLVTANLRENRL